jgi:pimeloyl-ACP methyl ester carboxylesterase
MAPQFTTFTTRAGARPGSRLGSGGTIIAVHGAISDHRSWTLCANDLASSFHVIAFTQRGFGSEAGQPLDVDEHADDLIEIATQAEHPVHVIGWSYGCEVAISAILRQPSLFARLALFDPSIGSIMDGDSAFAEAEGAFRASLASAAEKLHQKRAVDAALAFSEAVCGGQRENTDPLLEATVRDNAPSLGPFLSMTPRARLAVEQLPGRLLVMNGANSPLRYRMIGQRLARLVEHGSHMLIPNASHDGPWRAAASVGNTASRFFRT